MFRTTNIISRHRTESSKDRCLLPYINVANRILAQRHINSLLLGYFLRSLTKAEFEDGVLDRTNVDQFFLQCGGRPDPLRPFR